MLTVYGIPNCNTVQKVRAWLDKHNISYQFHDYKKSGIAEEKVHEWFKVFPWEKLVNKAGTTWKSFSDEQKQAITDEHSAAQLMVANTSVIKRPVVEDASGKAVALGFSEKEYEEKFL